MNNICPLCRGETKPYLNYQKIGKGDFLLLKCLGCDLVFTDPIPDENFLADFYQSYDCLGQKDNYYRDLKNYQRTKEGRALEKFFLAWAKNYKFNRNWEILDLGSGGGAFLDIIKRNGFNGLGVEISRQAVEFAESNFKVDCSIGDARQVDFAAQRFGAVFMWDLIEHLSGQGDLIEKIAHWLVDGGYLIIETPDNAALINKFVLGLMKLGINWPANWMFGYHHLFWHSEKSLSQLLTSNGFKILAQGKKNTAAGRIFPWSFKFFLPRIFLAVLNFLAAVFRQKNKLIIVAQK